MIVLAVRAAIRAVKLVHGKYGEHVTLQNLNAANESEKVKFLAAGKVSFTSVHTRKRSGRQCRGVRALFDAAKARLTNRNRNFLVVEDTIDNDVLLILYNKSDITAPDLACKGETEKKEALNSLTLLGFAAFCGMTIINLKNVGMPEGPVVKEISPCSFSITPAGQMGRFQSHGILEFDEDDHADNLAAIKYFSSVSSM